MPRERRNGCCRAAAEEETPVRSCCDDDGTFVEDMPMCRYENPIPVCSPCCCEAEDQGTAEALAAIEEALRVQNGLLRELTCALSGLTGVVLSCCRERPRDGDCRRA